MRSRAIGQFAAVSGSLLLLIAAVFAFAGFIKGVIGLGLPTVSIGLLAVVMPPAQAVAIVIVPAIVTNIWQTFAGPYLRDILRRLWPLMLGTVIGIRLGSGLMTGPYARYGTLVLGVLLVIYGILGLSRTRFHVSRSYEKWVGGPVGVVTGVVSAATGVQVIPSMPFMQAIGMEKNELVQALGVFFTTATLALAFNLTDAGLLSVATALPGGIAMVAAFAGMFAGQAVRDRMHPDVFRKWFLISIIGLGCYLFAETLVKMIG
ncbi:MAG: sulfite exporter TauE/SafE family protein [Rhodopseudomonas palustris]|uniref:Probable membrane transporter protein n=1 Tax=Rhodopseudomonas palustris TaxID=1076 RepID=A0A933RYH1_RHOPL|nr:sulfite exporter TauE/SafE family protein [Rhodopseudomonas palustris]